MLQVLELWSWFLFTKWFHSIKFVEERPNNVWSSIRLKIVRLSQAVYWDTNQATKSVELIRAEKWERFRKIILFFSFSMRFAKSGGINLREPERDGSSFVSGRDGLLGWGLDAELASVFDYLPHCWPNSCSSKVWCQSFDILALAAVI